MKRLSILLLLCIFLVPTLFAQSRLKMIVNEEGKLYVIPRYQKFNFEMPELSYTTLYNITTSGPQVDMQWQSPELIQEIPAFSGERPMDMQILSGAYRPFFNIYAPLYRRVYPTAFDYFEAYSYPLDERFDFVVSGLQSTWPGAGGINTVNVAMNWHNEKWEVWGGGFAGRYATPYDISPGTMTGVHAGASYQPAEWIKLKAWGQTTLYDKEGRNNMFLYLDSRHYNRAAVGGAMEFKVNENFGFGFGMQYNFNPMSNKWESEKLIYPVINKKGSFGISVN